MSNEFSTGKTLIVLGLVVGCFAILWPKIFYPMTQAALSITAPKNEPPNECKGLHTCYVNTHSAPYLCGVFGSLKDELLPQLSQDKGCRKAIRELCGIDLAIFAGNSTTLLEELRNCRERYEEQKLSKTTTLLHHRQNPPHLQGASHRPDRSKVQFREGRPFPHPSARQPPKQQPKTNGTMGILMPVYTIAIICFFLYTILKLVARKPSAEDDKPSIVKDFKMDPEHRKFVLSEQYDDQGHPMENKLRKRKTAENTDSSNEKDFFPSSLSDKDLEIHQLRLRLQDTEAAMERIMKHMGAVSECLAHTVAAPTEKTAETEKPQRPQELPLPTTNTKDDDVCQEKQEKKVISPDPDSYELVDSLPSSPLEILEPTLSSPDIEPIPSSDESPSIISLPDSSPHS